MTFCSAALTLLVFALMNVATIFHRNMLKFKGDQQSQCAADGHCRLRPIACTSYADCAIQQLHTTARDLKPGYMSQWTRPTFVYQEILRPDLSPDDLRRSHLGVRALMLSSIGDHTFEIVNAVNVAPGWCILLSCECITQATFILNPLQFVALVGLKHNVVARDFCMQLTAYIDAALMIPDLKKGIT